VSDPSATVALMKRERRRKRKPETNEAIAQMRGGDELDFSVALRVAALFNAASETRRPTDVHVGPGR